MLHFHMNILIEGSCETQRRPPATNLSKEYLIDSEHHLEPQVCLCYTFNLLFVSFNTL